MIKINRLIILLLSFINAKIVTKGKCIIEAKCLNVLAFTSGVANGIVSICSYSRSAILTKT